MEDMGKYMKSKFANLIILTIDVYILYAIFDGCYHRINPVLLDYGNAYRNLHVSSELMVTVIVSYLPVCVAVDQFSKLFSIDKEKREKICISTLNKMSYFMVISFITEAWIAKVITICNDNSIHISNIQSKNGLSSFLGLTMGWHIVFGIVDFFFIKRMIFGENRKKIRNDIHANKEDRSFKWFMLLLDLIFIFFIMYIITYIFLTTYSKVSFAPLILFILLFVPLNDGIETLHKILERKDTIFEDEFERVKPSICQEFRNAKTDMANQLTDLELQGEDSVLDIFNIIKDDKISIALKGMDLKPFIPDAKVTSRLSKNNVYTLYDLKKYENENDLARSCNISFSDAKKLFEFYNSIIHQLKNANMKYFMDYNVDYENGFFDDNGMIEAIYGYREFIEKGNALNDFYKVFSDYYKEHINEVEFYEDDVKFSLLNDEDKKRVIQVNDEVTDYLHSEEFKLNAHILAYDPNNNMQEIYLDFKDHLDEYLKLATNITGEYWYIKNSPFNFEADKEKSQIKAKEPAVKEVVRRDRESYFDILTYDKEDLQKYLATAKENAKDDLDYEYQFIKDNKIDEILEDTSLEQLKSVSSKLFEEMSNEGVESVDDLLSRYDENTLAKRFCIRGNVSHTIMNEAEEFKANLSESQLEYSIEPKVDFYDGFVGDNQIIKAIYHYREEMKYYDHIKEYYDSFLLFYENHKELLELYDNVDAYENSDLDTQKNANICNNEVYKYLRTKKHKTAMELTSSIDGDPEKIYNDFFNHQTDYLDVANSCTDGKWSIYDSEKEDTKYNFHIKVSSKGLSNADQSKSYYESALKHELRNTLYTLNLAHDEFLKAEGYASVEAHQENIKKAVNNKLRKYNLVGVHDLKELYEVALKRYEDSASVKELDDNLLLLKELSGYKDIYQYIVAHEQKKKSMISKEYNHAVDLANAHKFEEALIVCEAISSYTNVNDLRKKINVLRDNNDKRIGLYEYLVNQYTNANTLEIYDKLYYAFKELDGYKDAYKYMNQCKKHIDSMNAIKDRKEKKYQTARDMYKKSRTVQDYLKVQDLFSALHGYNDSQFYLNSISKEIRRLRELDAEKTNKSDNIFEDNGLGQLSDEEIQAILAMRQTKIIEKEDMSNTSEVLNDNHKELLELYDNVDAYENTDLDTQKNANICNNEVYKYLRTKKHKTAMELTSSIDGDPEKIYNDFFNHQTDYLDVANSCTDGKWSIYDSEKEDTKYNFHIKVSSKGLSNADQSKSYYESALKHELRNTLYTLNLAHDEFLKAEGYASVEAHQENIKKAVNNKLRKYNLVGVHDLKELYEVALKRYEDSASVKELDDNLLLLKELSGYKDIYQYIVAHEQKKKSMISKEYNHAVDLANAHKFEEALIVCEAISSYTNVNDLRKKINVLRDNNDKRIGLYEYLVNQYTNANTLEIYDKLYYAFKELDGYKDAYKYMNQCKKHIDSMNAIKDRKEKKYQTARDMYKKSRTVQDYLKVQDLFSALHGYNDSQFYLNSISKEIRRLRELDAEKTNKSDNIFEDNGLGQLSDEEIQAILAMRQTKIIEKEDMSNTSEELNDNHDKKKVEIEEDHKLITNSIFTINYSITDTSLDDCIYTIAIKDEFGSTMSDTKEINTNDANRKVTLTLKAGTTFDKTKEYKIVLMNKNNGKVLQEKKCKIDIVFTSDFDF